MIYASGPMSLTQRKPNELRSNCLGYEMGETIPRISAHHNRCRDYPDRCTMTSLDTIRQRLGLVGYDTGNVTRADVEWLLAIAEAADRFMYSPHSSVHHNELREALKTPQEKWLEERPNP